MDKTTTIYTNEDLKRMQACPLEKKVQVSQAKVMEFAEKLDNQIYVSIFEHF